MNSESKTVYLVFSHSGTRVSKAIKFVTKQKYSHVSISTNPRLDILYSFARKGIYNPLNAGFVDENFNRGIFKRHINEATCKVYKLRVDNKKYKALCNALENFRKNDEKLRYNILGMMSPVTGFPVARKDHYFCSQFVAEVLKESEAVNLGKSPLLYSPSDLLNELELKSENGEINVNLLYEGRVKNFNSIRKKL